MALIKAEEDQVALVKQEVEGKNKQIAKIVKDENKFLKKIKN